MPPTAYALPYASTDTQVLGGQGSGLSCSIPQVIEYLVFKRNKGEAPVSLQMRQACANHDFCYRHGAATYGYSQADCDYLLLEHAYRICRFINKKNSISKCVQRARKVALGVRIGGNAHFKSSQTSAVASTKTDAQKCKTSGSRLFDDFCTSTYFEFDPYPTRASAYSAYRIAAAPESWVERGSFSKALYVFRIKPTATQLTIVGWSSGGAPLCTGFILPAAYQYLQVPPQVAAMRAEGADKTDWFVWWRRRSLGGTSGVFALVDPLRASLEDWRRVFPGASTFVPEDCTYVVAQTSQGVKPASVIISAGFPKNREKDNEFSEVHVYPEALSDNKLHLFALRTHSCGQRNEPYGLCYLDLTLDPTRFGFQLQEPLKVRDDFNGLALKMEPDRYRNFASAPIVLIDGKERTVAWMRRGEANGAGYRNTAHLRRALTKGTRSRSAGIVHLTMFPEAAEPVFVLGRSKLQPLLVSVSANEMDGKIAFHHWKLPPPFEGKKSPKSDDANCHNPVIGDPQGTKRHELAVCRKQFVGTCSRVLRANWMIRPTVVYQDSKRPGLAVFNRLVVAADNSLNLEVRSAKLTNDGSCSLSEVKSFPLGIVDPKGLSVGNRSERQNTRVRARAASTLRARPILLSDLDKDGRLDLLVPHPTKPASSKVYSAAVDFP